MLKNLRIAIFNWMAAGRITVNSYELTKDNGNQTTFTLGNGGNLNYNYNYQLHNQVPRMNLNRSSINFNVAKANGGWIVQINHPGSGISIQGVGPDVEGDLYLIADDADFDKELGKIITASCLKA